jgi:hypothetical protein
LIPEIEQQWQSDHEGDISKVEDRPPLKVNEVNNLSAKKAITFSKYSIPDIAENSSENYSVQRFNL